MLFFFPFAPSMNIIHILEVICRTLNPQEQWRRSPRARKNSSHSRFLFTWILLQECWCLRAGLESILEPLLPWFGG